MSSAWSRRSLTKENEYFARQCREVVEKIKGGPKVSPVSGEKLVSSVYRDIEVLRDPKTGGMWVDEDKLEELLESARSGNKSTSWKDVFRFELV